MSGNSSLSGEWLCLFICINIYRHIGYILQSSRQTVSSAATFSTVVDQILTFDAEMTFSGINRQGILLE